MSLCYKIEYRQTLLVWRKSKATAQLLKEDREALCWAQEQNGINFWYVYTFIINIDHTKVVYLLGFELT